MGKETEDQEPSEAGVMSKSLLTISLVVLIASRSVDRALYTRLAYALPDYLWYLGNIILPIAFLVISWPVVWYKMLFTDDITPEMRKFPLYKFAIMGLFDSLFNLLSTFPTPHLGGNLSLVLSQTVLPMNMGLSIVCLKTRYKKSHYIGATLTIYGALVNLIPFFLGEAAAANTDPTLGWIMLSVVSNLPAAASNVYKEIGLKGADLDIWYANAWIGVFQLFWGIITFWTIHLSAFQTPAIAWSDIPSYLSNANACFLGSDSVVSVGGAPVNCSHHALLLFVVFIVFNITYNQLMLYVFKNGSSVLFVVASAVGLPLVDLLYMWPWLAGKAYQRFTLYDGFALFALVMAILTYYSDKEDRVTDGKLEPKTPQFLSPRTERNLSFDTGGDYSFLDGSNSRGRAKSVPFGGGARRRSLDDSDLKMEMGLGGRDTHSTALLGSDRRK